MSLGYKTKSFPAKLIKFPREKHVSAENAETGNLSGKTLNSDKKRLTNGNTVNKRQLHNIANIPRLGGSVCKQMHTRSGYSGQSYLNQSNHCNTNPLRRDYSPPRLYNYE